MNVLLVMHREEDQHLLLPHVLRELRELGDCYRVRLVYDKPSRLKHRLWTLGLPAWVISMRPVATWPAHRFNPAWATVWEQAPLDKIQECMLLEKAGIPVPRWWPVYQHSEPEFYGMPEFVVVKPAQGSMGALVRVMRRDRVRWEPLRVNWHMLEGGAAVCDALIAQEYIHTGPWPTSYRVATVFGEPTYAVRCIADRSRKPFDETKSGSSFFDGRTIVASSRGCRFDTSVPKDVIELARRAHYAFPTVPSLGVDVIRDWATERPYVVEVNAAGWGFHLTSVAYERFLREFGIDFLAQFGGAAAVARGIHRRLCESNTWEVTADYTKAIAGANGHRGAIG